MKTEEEIIQALIDSNLIYESDGKYFVGLNSDFDITYVVEDIVESLTDKGE